MFQEKREDKKSSVEIFHNFRKKLAAIGGVEKLQEHPELISELEEYMDFGGPFPNCGVTATENKILSD